MLSYLGLMAVARILFELAFDFLVIKGQSRSILLVQLLWLSLLVPALIVGASFAGLRGVAIAQTAVAILVVLPAYALLLRRAGLHPRTLARQVLPALLVGLIVAGLTHLISSELSSAFLACVLSGLIGLVGVGGLLASNKHLTARFRSLRGQAVAT